MKEEYLYLKKRIESADGFIGYLPLTIDLIETGCVKATLNMTERILNPFGTVHGGCLFTVADSIAGTAAMTHGRYVTTISGHIHYLSPAVGKGQMKIVAEEVRAGKTILTYDVAFLDESDHVVCKATMEYFALNKIDYE